MIDGVDVASYDLVNTTANFVFEDLSYEFTPTATSTTIEFQNRQNATQHFSYVDNVSFTEVPEPTTMLLLLCGLVVWVARRPARHVAA